MGKMIKVNETPAYLAVPENEIKGGILVIHEVWGLDDHIKSVADRLANEGYLALAPDLLAGSDLEVERLRDLKDSLFDPEQRSAAQPQLRKLMAPMQNPDFGKATKSKTVQCFDYLYHLPEVRQSVAVIGFCFGGTYSYILAVNEPRLQLALPFYGHADFLTEELKKIACPIRAFYGEKDKGLAEQMEKLPPKMKAADVDFEQKIYTDCGHAFFNDTNKFTFNRAAATDAWEQSLAYLTKYVKS